MSIGSPDYEEMKNWLGGGNRLASAMNRQGIKTMAAMDELYTKLGEDGFTLHLWCIPNVGEASVQQILAGVKDYRSKKDNGGTPMATVSDSYMLWTRNTTPAHLMRNAGCSDYLLAANLTYDNAVNIKERLEAMYEDAAIEIHPSNKSPEPGSVGSNG